MSKKNNKYIKKYKFPLGLDIGLDDPIIIAHRKYQDNFPRYGLLYLDGTVCWFAESLIEQHIIVHGESFRVPYVQKE